ncbi:hypothetical protein DL96DRAFT_1812750 [Flagelloscypha sp. PMI_526]|nr:hypothetical protein DL96DRAFT_1812750 [Flagelloscypha sp. PMI_526]
MLATSTSSNTATQALRSAGLISGEKDLSMRDLSSTPNRQGGRKRMQTLRPASKVATNMVTATPATRIRTKGITFIKMKRVFGIHKPAAFEGQDFVGATGSTVSRRRRCVGQVSVCGRGVGPCLARIHRVSMTVLIPSNNYALAFAARIPPLAVWLSLLSRYSLFHQRINRTCTRRPAKNAVMSSDTPSGHWPSIQHQYAFGRLLIPKLPGLAMFQEETHQVDGSHAILPQKLDTVGTDWPLFKSKGASLPCNSATRSIARLVALLWRPALEEARTYGGWGVLEAHRFLAKDRCVPATSSLVLFNIGGYSEENTYCHKFLSRRASCYSNIFAPA